MSDTFILPEYLRKDVMGDMHMRIVNFGSLNLDYVYAVDHIVAPGETISSNRVDVFCGGKGLNQSVALARAGADVFHAGMVGPDGDPLIALCKECGINSDNIRRVEERSGNAIIQVAADGQNSIVLFGGANRKNTIQHIEDVLSNFSEGDMVLLQNEINLIDCIIEIASAKGMIIALNPSPFDAMIKHSDLGKVSYFLVNEVEGGQITGKDDPGDILDCMLVMFPKAAIVLTLGSDGAMYRDNNSVFTEPATSVSVVDTTAAGDTFAGYFLADLLAGQSPDMALATASHAAGLAVSCAGATASIPQRKEVDQVS